LEILTNINRTRTPGMLFGENYSSACPILLPEDTTHPKTLNSMPASITNKTSVQNNRDLLKHILAGPTTLADQRKTSHIYATKLNIQLRREQIEDAT
jgi:hypothetical protein